MEEKNMFFSLVDAIFLQKKKQMSLMMIIRTSK